MTEQPSIDYDRELVPAPKGTKWAGYRTLEAGQTVIEIILHPPGGPITAVHAGRSGDLIERGAFMEGFDRQVWRVRWDDGETEIYEGAVKFTQPPPGEDVGSVIDAALCPGQDPAR